MQIAALSEWFQSVLGISSIFHEPGEIDESALPGVLLEHDHDGPGDVLDPALVAEHYQAILIAPIMGATSEEKETGVGALERKLLLAVKSLQRVNAAWEHITAEFSEAERGAGVSIWNLTLYVRDEGG